MKIAAKIISVILVIALVACSKVPITGRKQMLLIPESELMSMSLTQYQQFLTENPPVADNVEATKQVRRVGGRIANAVERYLKVHGQSKVIKNYKMGV